MQNELDQKNQSIQKLAELIKEIRVAMFTTLSSDHQLFSRPMATQTAEFDGSLWFFSDANSPKTAELVQNPMVNVAYSDPSHQRYVSVSGQATVVKDLEKAKSLWTPLMKAWFPQGVEDPNLCLIQVEVESAEYWDSPSSTMVHLIGFAKAVLTGKRYTPGDNETLRVATH